MQNIILCFPKIPEINSLSKDVNMLVLGQTSSKSIKIEFGCDMKCLNSYYYTKIEVLSITS